MLAAYARELTDAIHGCPGGFIPVAHSSGQHPLSQSAHSLLRLKPAVRSIALIVNREY